MATDLLDANGVIKKVYDPDTESLNTNATVVATIGDLDVSIDPSEDGIAVYGTDGSTNRQLKTDSSGELQVDVLSSALPSGAATAARQDTGNTSLASIDTKLDSLTVDVGNFPAVQPVNDNGGSLTVDGTVSISGSVTVTGPLTDAELRATPVSVSDGGSSITIDGSISVSNFPAVQPVSDNGSSITVDGTIAATQSGTWNINNISGVINLPTGASTESTLSTLNAKFVSGTDIGDVTINNANGASAVNIQDGGNSITVDGTVAATQSGTWDVNVANQSSATGTVTSVARSASVQTVLSANANRKGFMLWNDAAAVCYIRFESGATTTTFSVRMSNNTGYEPSIHVNYTGIITCIWASAGTGNLLVTEFT